MSTNDPGAKALVFSQFVNMLDVMKLLFCKLIIVVYYWLTGLLLSQLISFRLHLEGISCSKLLGYMTVDNRDEVLESRCYYDPASIDHDSNNLCSLGVEKI